MYTPETIKPNLEMFIRVAQGITPLLRGSAGQTVKDILDMLSSVLTQDWFLELLCYLLNTFNADEPSKIQLAEALKFFAHQQENGGTPIAMGIPAEVTRA